MRNKNKNIFEQRDCLSKEELISYSKGALSEKEKHHVEKHLADCELCTDALEGILLLRDPAMLNNISREMIHSMGEKNFIINKNKTRPAYLAAAAVVCIFILSGIYFAFMRNSENLKSEMAVLPVKQEEVKSIAPAAPEINKPDEKLNESVDNSIAAESKPNSQNKSEAELKKEISQSQITFTDAATIENNVQEPMPMSEPATYNGAVADNEKANEEITIAVDKKEVPAAGVSIHEYKATMTDSLQTAPAEKYSMVEKSEASASKVYLAKKNTSMVQQTNIDDALKDVEKKMEYENFSDALKELKSLAKEYPADMKVVYYTGRVYYKTNETAQALTCFTDVLKSGDKKLFEDARYHKALTYVKMNDKVNARKILSQIMADKSSYKERAEGILEQMDGN